MKAKHYSANLQWTLSIAVYIALVAVANVPGLIKAALYMLAMVILGLLLPEMGQYCKSRSRIQFAATAWIVGKAGWDFCEMWRPSSLVRSIAQKIGLESNILLMVAAVLGAGTAFYSIRCLIGAVFEMVGSFREKVERIPSLDDSDYRMKITEYLFLLAMAAVVITICSKSSPIYLLNDWGDSNCYFTTGKSLLHGKVLYRDVFEHKGFYLYALHALGYLISNTSFFGVYLLEIAAAFVFLICAYRIALLFCSDDCVLYVIPVLAATVYGAHAFSHGDSAEEFCLPLLAYALWVGVKAAKCEVLPSKKEYFWIGVTSGVVFWIKYTILGFYLGWYAYFGLLMIKRRMWKELFDSIKWIFLGVLVISIPVLLYFLFNRALADLWQVYFYNNIFVYSGSSDEAHKYGVLGNVFSAAYKAALYDNLLAMILVGAVLWHSVGKNKEPAKVLLSSLVGTACVFVGDISYPYYAFVFCVFSAMALPGAYALCNLIRLDKRVYTICGLILAVMLNNNAYMLEYERNDIPQYAFKEIIDQVPQPTLLNYGFLDGGFYTVNDIVPQCKYFFKPNIGLKEIDRTQDYWVEHGLVDFVVTRDQELDAELYACVSEKSYMFEGETWKFRLYALKELEL